MIARFSEGRNRDQLGFAEAVMREFVFLEASYGFRRIKEVTTYVRYESEFLFLNVFHGRGSYEIGVELGRLSDPAVHYRLPSLIVGLAPGYSGRTVFQASERRAVENCVAQVAHALRTHCGAALSGDAEALRLVEKVATAESERETLQAQFGAIIERADQAWEAKNLRLATDLYQQADPALNGTRGRRLKYLLRNRRGIEK